jgi:hypothetical protein
MLNRNTFLMVLAQWISTAGSQLHLLALPLIIYQQTGSTQLLALGFLAETLPWMILAPKLSPSLSRFSSQNIMIIADVARTVLCVMLALIPFQAPLFLVLMFFLGSFNAIYGTYRLKQLKSVTTTTDLQKVLGISTSGIEVLQIIAPATGAAIIAFGWSARALMLVDGASFVLSAFLIVFVKANEQEETVSSSAPASLATTRQSYLKIWQSPGLRAISVTEGLRSIAEALFIPTIVVILEKQHGMGSSYLGWSQTCTSAGALLMAVGFIRLKGESFRTLGPAIALFLLSLVKALFLIPANPVFVLALASVLGVAMSFRQLSAELSIMENLEDSFSAGLIAAYNSIVSTAYIIGYALSAVLNSYLVVAALASGLCLFGALYQLKITWDNNARTKAVSAA